MIKGIDILIGGIEVSNSFEACGKFIFPEDQPVSYLMDAPLCKAFVEALDKLVGLKKMPSIGSTDVCFDYEQAEQVIQKLRQDQKASDDQINALTALFLRWEAIPHSGLLVWWNRTPYAFDLLPVGWVGGRD
jgi:hypothetical protein